MRSRTPPVLLITFNRPELTQKVFSQIRKAKPNKLFISSDGPRNELDEKKISKIRKITQQVDWDCQIFTLFQEKNLGCKKGVSAAINWFFSEVDAGIILEDDCLPNESFFEYCQKLLKKYAENEKIMMISGTNPLNTWDTENSYFFSLYGNIWGWATWKRAWKHYDMNMKDWSKPNTKKSVKANLGSSIQFFFRKKLYDAAVKNSVDTWDYAWSFARVKKNGLTIMPRYNLIKNLGFGVDATHTTSTHNAFSHLQQYNIEKPLTHPIKIERDKQFDDTYFWKLMIETKIIALLHRLGITAIMR